MNEKEKIKKELNRIKCFIKEHYLYVVISFILTLLFMNYLFDKKKINNNILKGGSLIKNVCETDEISSKSKIIFCYLFGYEILKKLQDKYKNNKIGFGLIPQKIFIYPVWFFRSFIYRPIYGAFMILVVLFAISGSFIFPFVMFGILLYYIMKSVFTKYSDNKKKNLKINENDTNKNNSN